MSSWPPTLVDWAELTPRLHAGAPVCVVHGLVAAEQAPIGIPICPHCRQAVMVTVRDAGGVLRGFTSPSPAHCPQGHPLTGGHVLLGWQSCSCPNASPGPGGHRTWSCITCGRVAEPLRWPPHAAELP